MVGMRGFEPPTPSSRTRCATRLRYIPYYYFILDELASTRIELAMNRWLGFVENL